MMVAQYVRTVRSHVEVLRPHNFPVPIVAAWAGAAVATGQPRLDLAIVPIAAVPLLVWAGGQLLNDFFDRAADARSKPYLPIPRGDVRPIVALFLACLFDFLAIAYALLTTPAGGQLLTLVLVSLGIVGTVLYSQALKASGLAGNLMMGTMMALVVLVGAAMTGAVGVTAVIVAAACLLNHSAQNLVGAIRDVDGDRWSDIGTLAVHLGIRKSLGVALALQIGGLALGVVPAIWGALHPIYLVLPALLLPLLVWRFVEALRIAEMPVTVKLFKTYRIWSILFYGSFVAGTFQNIRDLLIIGGILALLGAWAIVFQELQREANVPA